MTERIVSHNAIHLIVWYKCKWKAICVSKLCAVLICVCVYTAWFVYITMPWGLRPQKLIWSDKDS